MTANTVTAEELMAHTPAALKTAATTNGSSSQPKSSSSSKDKKGSVSADSMIDPLKWGLPGYLTKDETDIYFKLSAEVEKRGGDFKDTVYSFGEIEGEMYTLCRWLRARKFVYDDVITMIEEATVVRKIPKQQEFYPCPSEALGCDINVYLTQYPQLYEGTAKNGAIFFISKPGVLQVDGVDQITSIDGIIKYHWNAMIHDFGKRLRDKKASDPNFHRFEICIVMDLAGLTMGQLTSKALAIVKEQSKIDSLCFPETLSKMIIVNAPKFFSATWSLIKSWIDPRTASKVEVLSSKSTWEPKLKELIDEQVLPSDYGGKNTDSTSIIQRSCPEGMKRQPFQLLYVRGHTSHVLEVSADESVEIEIFTRSLAGGTFTVYDDKKKEVLKATKLISPNEDPNDKPNGYPVKKTLNAGLDKRLSGPNKYKIKADSHGSRFSSEKFLLVFHVYKK